LSLSFGKFEEVDTVPAWKALVEVCNSITTELQDTHPRMQACAYILGKLYLGGSEESTRMAICAFTRAAHQTCLARCGWAQEALGLANEQLHLLVHANGVADVCTRYTTMVQVFGQYSECADSMYFFETLLYVAEYAEMNCRSLHMIRSRSKAVALRMHCGNEPWYLNAMNILTLRIDTHRKMMREKRKYQQSSVPFLSGQEGATT